MNRNTAESLLVLGMVLALAACTSWPKVSEDREPASERADQIVHGPGPTGPGDFPDFPAKEQAQ